MASSYRKRTTLRSTCALAPLAGLAWTLAALPLTGCSDKEPSQDSETGTGTDGSSWPPSDPVNPHHDECMDDETFFQEKVWRPVLQAQCKNCHNSSGVAKESKLVLVGSEWGPTYLQHNRDVLHETAINQREGKSILLLKPIGKADHGGGEVLTEGSEAFSALKEFVQRIDKPVSCGDTQKNTVSTYAGMKLSDDEATLRKASLSLVGRLPTPEELAEMKSDGEEGLANALDKIMHEEAFYDRLIVLFNDHFLTDEYLGRQDALALLDGEDYPDYMWFSDLEDEKNRNTISSRTNRAVAREVLELIVYIVRNHRSFEEVLTADYMVVNPYSARAYGIDAKFQDPLNPEEFVPGRIDGVPHAGVLTSSMFLNRFPTTATNRNRHRSKMVYRFFLATDLEALASRPLDPTQIADHNPTLNNPSCTVCHANMDPVAGALQNWDARGRYRPPEDGWYPEMASPGFNDTKMPSSEVTRGAQWLAKQIVKDKRFAFSIVHMVYQMLTGHTPVKEPQDSKAPDYEANKLAFEAQSREFARIAEDFAANGFELRDIFAAIIKSPSYRAAIDTPLTPVQQKLLSATGNTRLLTPEQLNAKIRSTLGYPWRPSLNDTDYLLSSRWYAIFFGGIDSDNVVQRITEPNGIMANVIDRMANEMSCWSTTRDFSLDASKRILFPHVETSFVPMDDNGFAVPHAQQAIRKNLVHLHKRLLGVALETGSPEIDLAYKLYEDLWKDAQPKIKDKTISDYLYSPCRSTRDYWTGKELPKEQQISRDPNFSIRAWAGVVNYLLTDYRFLHE